jgi:hypothetical protein
MAATPKPKPSYRDIEEPVPARTYTIYQSKPVGTVDMTDDGGHMSVEAVVLHQIADHIDKQYREKGGQIHDRYIFSCPEVDIKVLTGDFATESNC